MDMKPYVVRQGDYLARIAHQLGFDPDVVWGNPKNAEIKKKRAHGLPVTGELDEAMLAALKDAHGC